MLLPAAIERERFHSPNHSSNDKEHHHDHSQPAARGLLDLEVVAKLAEKRAEVHTLTRSPEKTKFPRGVTPVKGNSWI